MFPNFDGKINLNIIVLRLIGFEPITFGTESQRSYPIEL